MTSVRTKSQSCKSELAFADNCVAQGFLGSAQESNIPIVSKTEQTEMFASSRILRDPCVMGRGVSSLVRKD